MAQVTRVGRKRGPSPVLCLDLSVPVGPLEALCEETAMVAVRVCRLQGLRADLENRTLLQMLPGGGRSVPAGCLGGLGPSAW